MEAKDLMIGDWVCYDKPNNYYTQVNEICKTNDGEESYIKCIRSQKDSNYPGIKDSFNTEILHPIPLTPEILEKNGWVNEHFGTQRQEWWLDKTKFPIVRYSVNDTLHHNGIVLKFVHQLQHALKLCGIDKEIEL